MFAIFRIIIIFFVMSASVFALVYLPKNERWGRFCAYAAILTGIMLLIMPLLPDKLLKYVLVVLVALLVILISLVVSYAPTIFIMFLAGFILWILAAWIAYANVHRTEIMRGLYPIGWTREQKMKLFKNCLRWAPLKFLASFWYRYQTKKEYEKNK